MVVSLPQSNTIYFISFISYVFYPVSFALPTISNSPSRRRPEIPPQFALVADVIALLPVISTHSHTTGKKGVGKGDVRGELDFFLVK